MPDQETIDKVFEGIKKKLPKMPIYDKDKFFFKSDEEEQEINKWMEQPPFLAGSMTHWKFIPMMKIEDFIITHDHSFKDPFDYMKENQMVNENIKNRCDMENDDIKTYIKEREIIMTSYQKKWLKILTTSCLKYKHPQFLNIEKFEEYPS